MSVSEHTDYYGRDIRNTHDILASIAGLLEEMLAEAKRSNSTAREGAVSSVEIKDLASGKPQVTCKVYAGSPIHDLVDEALEEHGRAHREAEARALAGWAETVDAELRKAVGALPFSDKEKVQ